MATRRAQTSGESRRMLVRAAAELFAERGYRATTFADVAERSGISRGSIPWHFGNKEGLLAAVIDQMTAQMREIFTDPSARPTGTGTGHEGLDRALAQAELYTRRPATRLFVTLLAEAVEPGSPLHARYADLHRLMREGVRSWIDAAGLPPGTTPDDFAVVLLGTIIGIHQQWRMAPEAVDLDRAYDTLRAILTATLSRTPTTPAPTR